MEPNSELLWRVAFKREADLQKFLSEQDLTSTRGHTLVRRELPVGGEIPDLIYITFSRRPPADLWPARWTFRHAFLVWQLRRRSRLQVTTLARRSFLPLDRTQVCLNDLLNCGAVEKASTGAFTLSPRLAELDAEVLAVEVKLRRWKDALRQAASYARFADRAAVAMESTGIPRGSQRLLVFKRRGIGLCSVSGGDLEWVIPPRQRQVRRCAEREYMIASATDSQRQRSWSLL